MDKFSTVKKKVLFYLREGRKVTALSTFVAPEGRPLVLPSSIYSKRTFAPRDKVNLDVKCCNDHDEPHAAVCFHHNFFLALPPANMKRCHKKMVTSELHSMSHNVCQSPIPVVPDLTARIRTPHLLEHVVAVSKSSTSSSTLEPCTDTHASKHNTIAIITNRI